jgi:Leucine-rich repeat (LRR) protein
LRPAAPTCSPDPSSSGAYYTQYITVTVSAETGRLYVSNDGEIPSVDHDAYKDGITLKEGKNVIYAIAVADNGLVSPTAIFGFTVGGVIEQVTFEDAAVEAAIRELLVVDTEKVLYTNDLWTIKEFTVPENAENLKDLRHMAFLEKLTISNAPSNQLASIAGLANLKELTVTETPVSAEEIAHIGRLPNITKLTLRKCSVSTLAGLQNADTLTHLDLNNNAIGNILPLSGLTKLQELNLSQNALKELSALSTLTAITVLDVSNNEIATLSPITALEGIKKLIAGNNTLTDVNGFEKLKALTEVDLSNNQIENVSPLASCTELTKLNISHNAVKDITGFSVLVKLTDLRFTNNKVSKLPEFPKDCELVNIDGSYNKLDTLVPLGGLKKLNNVFMDYNSGITSVKALANCPMLIQVNVYGTGVRQVSALTSNNENIIVNYNPTR